MKKWYKFTHREIKETSCHMIAEDCADATEQGMRYMENLYADPRVKIFGPEVSRSFEMRVEEEGDEPRHD